MHLHCPCLGIMPALRMGVPILLFYISRQAEFVKWRRKLIAITPKMEYLKLKPEGIRILGVSQGIFTKTIKTVRTEEERVFWSGYFKEKRKAQSGEILGELPAKYHGPSISLGTMAPRYLSGLWLDKGLIW